MSAVIGATRWVYAKMLSFKEHMEARTEFRLGSPRPKTPDSFIEVDGLAKDVWVVDRVFNKDEADRIGKPFKKKGQAVRKAREIARETGEKLMLDPDGPKGPLPAKEIRR